MTTPTYHATKYDTPQDEFLHDIAAYWTVEYDGNSEAPTGWWQVLDFTNEDLIELRRNALTEDAFNDWLRQILAELDRYAPEIITVTELFGVPITPRSDMISQLARLDYYTECFGFFILSGDERGFCYTTRYPDAATRDKAIVALQEQYSEWDQD